MVSNQDMKLNISTAGSCMLTNIQNNEIITTPPPQTPSLPQPPLKVSIYTASWWVKVCNRFGSSLSWGGPCHTHTHPRPPSRPLPTSGLD
jgi:hypothetical protein